MFMFMLQYTMPIQSSCEKQKTLFKYLVANATLFGYLFHIYSRYRYNMEVDEEKIHTYNISVGVLHVALSARCGLEAWML
jgi:hypothetical protein